MPRYGQAAFRDWLGVEYEQRWTSRPPRFLEQTLYVAEQRAPGIVLDLLFARQFARALITAPAPARREFVARRRAVIAANPELQEREALKALGLTASMADALARRGISDLTAHVAAQFGSLAWKIAYDRWIDTPNGEDFGEIARRTLDELQAASAVLTTALSFRL